eukprot:TRINITY_DN30689_c0_g1_i1.p1 TRINITY_DN30689_c0_g1~~TRINITY_DN30689_c0_g1_i1.p1  ORF type:complete len:249 (+),score=34.09 TRINITY_DN30689_c0_g1_i1:162-908(+)
MGYLRSSCLSGWICRDEDTWVLERFFGFYPPTSSRRVLISLVQSPQRRCELRAAACERMTFCVPSVVFGSLGALCQKPAALQKYCQQVSCGLGLFCWIGIQAISLERLQEVSLKEALAGTLKRAEEAPSSGASLEEWADAHFAKSLRSHDKARACVPPRDAGLRALPTPQRSQRTSSSHSLDSRPDCSACTCNCCDPHGEWARRDFRWEDELRGGPAVWHFFDFSMDPYIPGRRERRTVAGKVSHPFI